MSPASPAASGSPPVPAVRVLGAEKSFGAIRALRGVDIELQRGEVHSLVGANGAGKSTLAKIIAGALRPDSGSVEIQGRTSEQATLSEHRAMGVAALYQETTIVPHMSAAANGLLGRWRSRGPWLDRAATRKAFLEHCDELGVRIDPDVPAANLSVAEHRMIEIIRAIDARHEVLIMDEPTATLGPEEREHFYRVVEDLVASGASVLYISHDLPEVLRLSQRVSVMRDGELVASRPVEGWTQPELVGAMLGRAMLTETPEPRRIPDEMLLRVRDLELPGRLRSVSFEVRRGEIVGIAGLVGAGRSEILRCLAGLEPGASGRIVIDGAERGFPRSVREALRLGIAMTPEDRRRQGVVPWMTGEANVTLADLPSLSRSGVVDARRRRDAAERVAERVGLPEEMLGRPATTLSGGNQQKLVVGRWVQRPPALLLLDEPTMGVDIGAKREMLDFVRRVADTGVSVIVVSAEWDELIATCDRILVLAKGTLVGEFARGEATQETILRRVFGVAEEPVA